MDLFAWSAVLLALVLVSTGLLHIYNVNRVHKKLMKIGHCQTTKEAFFKEMTVAQGSNFTALAFAGWVLDLCVHSLPILPGSDDTTLQLHAGPCSDLKLHGIRHLWSHNSLRSHGDNLGPGHAARKL